MPRAIFWEKINTDQTQCTSIAPKRTKVLLLSTYQLTKNIPQMINVLITANAHKEAIMDIFRDIQILMTADKFEHDFKAI